MKDYVSYNRQLSEFDRWMVYSHVGIRSLVNSEWPRLIGMVLQMLRRILAKVKGRRIGTSMLYRQALHYQH